MNGYDEKEYIKQLQTYLYYLSLRNKELPSIAADGIYGNETRNAVIAYQKMRGLPVTGVADQVCWDAVKYDYDALMGGCSDPLPLYVFPGRGYVVKAGEHSETVYILQSVLRCLDAEYGFGDDIKVTGTYSEDDAEAVKKIQSVHGLPPSGQVDCATWDCLAADYSVFCRLSEYASR